MSGPDLLRQLCDLLEAADVRICLCFECKHQAASGPCAKCWCGNKGAVARAPKQAEQPDHEFWKGRSKHDRCRVVFLGHDGLRRK